MVWEEGIVFAIDFELLNFSKGKRCAFGEARRVEDSLYNTRAASWFLKGEGQGVGRTPTPQGFKDVVRWACPPCDMSHTRLEAL